MTPEVRTGLNSPEPPVGNDIPYDTVRRMVGASQAVLLGVTLIRRETHHDYRAETRPAPDGAGVCLALRAVDLDIVHTVLTIQIAKHVRPGSCTYEVTLEHERGHVAYERGAVKKAMKEIAAEIAQPIGLFHGADEAAARAAIEGRIRRWADTLKTRADKIARRGHGYLDIQSNIKGSLARCPDWHQS